jgi:hypothetical protein
MSEALPAQPVPSLKLKSQSDFDSYMSVGEETKGEAVRVKQPSQHPSLMQLDLSSQKLKVFPKFNVDLR